MKFFATTFLFAVGLVAAQSEGTASLAASPSVATPTAALGASDTTLTLGALQETAGLAAAVPSTVTLVAGGAGETGAAAAAAAETGAPSTANALVVPGVGIDGAGESCGCNCLCGMDSFPANAAMNNFGGFPGMMP